MRESQKGMNGNTHGWYKSTVFQSKQCGWAAACGWEAMQLGTHAPKGCVLEGESWQSSLVAWMENEQVGCRGESQHRVQVVTPKLHTAPTAKHRASWGTAAEPTDTGPLGRENYPPSDAAFAPLCQHTNENSCRADFTLASSGPQQSATDTNLPFHTLLSLISPGSLLNLISKPATDGFISVEYVWEAKGEEEEGWRRGSPVCLRAPL